MAYIFKMAVQQRRVEVLQKDMLIVLGDKSSFDKERFREGQYF